MRILYDGSLYGFQSVGGINRYFSEIISRLPESVAPTISVADVSRSELPSHPRLKCYGGISRGWPKQLANWRQREHFRRVYSSIEMDLVHPTYYSLLSSKVFKAFACPVVLTVYDMIHERFPQLVDRRGRNAAMKRAAIQAADAIICISQSTKQDLLEYYAIPEDRISVIHLAACLASRGENSRDPATTGSSFLYVGSRAPYKNFDLLLDAMNALISTRLDCRLNVVGPPFTERERMAISRLGLTRHIMHQGVVSDNELTSLYRASQALVYPSRYEGFGIPLLEAMQCKTAIVASNTSSIPEVVGDAALLFDPDSPEQLAAQLRDLLTLPELRETMICKGLARSEQFSWQATAATTLDVYRAVFAGRPVGAINHIVECEQRRKESASSEAA